MVAHTNFLILLCIVQLLLMPAGSDVVTVKGIERHGTAAKYAQAGDHVSLGITGTELSSVRYRVRFPAAPCSVLITVPA